MYFENIERIYVNGQKVKDVEYIQFIIITSGDVHELENGDYNQGYYFASPKTILLFGVPKGKNCIKDVKLELDELDEDLREEIEDEAQEALVDAYIKWLDGGENEPCISN